MNIKRIVGLLSAVCAMICIFSSCNTDEPEVTTLPVSDQIETEPPVTEKLVLIENGKTDFKITRSEDAEGYYLDTATAVYQKLKAEYSPDFKLGEDWLNPLEPSPETAHEILLFSTARAESQAALADLGFDGYIIRVTDCKIVIVGSGISQCNAALYHFFDEVIPANTENGVTALPVGLEIKTELADVKFDLKTALGEGKKIGAHITEVFFYPAKDGFTASQGAATDGKYAYIIVKKKEGSKETDKIVKVDMATWEVVAVSEELALDHANDMTYDPVRGQLAVVHMLNGIISFIDPETLMIAESTKHSFSSTSIEYIEKTEQYMLRAGNSFIYTDKDLNQLSRHTVHGHPEDADKYVGQGSYADENFLYIPRSPQTGQNENIVLICDPKGNYITTVSILTKMESETMFRDPVTGQFYMNFSKSASVVCELEFYEVFE